MTSILEQLTTEYKRQSLLPILTLLGRPVKLDYNSVKSVDFKKKPVADSVDRYLEVRDGEVQIHLQSYYIHPHNGDHNIVDSYRGPVPKESIDDIYSLARRKLIEHLEVQEKMELRQKEDLNHLRALIKRYGIPDDVEK